MYYSQKVKIPKKGSKVYALKKDKYIYVYYETGRTYDRKTQKTSPKRVSIGKLDDINDTEMWPNEQYLKYFGDNVEEVEKEVVHKMDASVKAGTMMLLDRIVEEYGMKERLVDIGLSSSKADLLLDVASYMIIENSNVAQHYEGYAYNHVLFDEDNHGYSDSTIGRLFGKDLDDNYITNFTNAWCGRKDKDSPIYISYDSTNKNCQSGDILIAEYGHAKDDADKPIINYSMAYDCTNSEPLFYELYPGSINDVVQLSSMIEKASSYKFRKLRFILDRGYFSEENFKEMRANDYEYLIMFKNDRSREFSRSMIDKARGTFEDRSRNYSNAYRNFGTTVHGCFLGMDHWIHIYFSQERKSCAMTQIMQDVADAEKYLIANTGKRCSLTDDCRKYFDCEMAGGVLKSWKPANDRIDTMISYCGYFIILSSYETDYREALKLYKSRDVSEKVFRSDKSFLGNRTMKVESEEVLKGKTFTSFIAQILRNRMHKHISTYALSSERKQNWMNVEALIEEMEKITLAVGGDGRYRLYNSISARQKEILSAFGITESNARNMIAEMERKLTEARRREGEELLKNVQDKDADSDRQED